MFILVDGIFPSYSRFAKCIKEPLFNNEKNYTAWQEGARKDIERAFGGLKATWQFVAKPIMMHNLKSISDRVTTCMILHNVIAADRVMGTPGLWYNPAASHFTSNEFDIEQPDDLLLLQHQHNQFADIVQEMEDSALKCPESVVDVVTRRDRWLALSNVDEHARLHAAFLEKFGNNKKL